MKERRRELWLVASTHPLWSAIISGLVLLVAGTGVTVARGVLTGDGSDGAQGTPPIATARTAGEANYRGYGFFLDGQFEEAISAFDSAISLDPEFEDAYYNRGRTHYELGDLVAALADFDRAIELDAEDAANYYWRAATYHFMQNDVAAIEDLQKALAFSNDAELTANAQELLDDLEGTSPTARPLPGDRIVE